MTVTLSVEISSRSYAQIEEECLRNGMKIGNYFEFIQEFYNHSKNEPKTQCKNHPALEAHDEDDEEDFDEDEDEFALVDHKTEDLSKTTTVLNEPPPDLRKQKKKLK